VTTRFREAYVDDLTEAYAYLAGESLSAAERFIERVEHLVGLIEDFPEIGRRREELAPGLRSFRVQGFRFVVYYEAKGRDVIMVRILHGARRVSPAYFVGG
jgi:toxin ParE1/3/4